MTGGFKLLFAVLRFASTSWAPVVTCITWALQVIQRQARKSAPHPAPCLMRLKPGQISEKSEKPGVGPRNNWWAKFSVDNPSVPTVLGPQENPWLLEVRTYVLCNSLPQPDKSTRRLGCTDQGRVGPTFGGPRSPSQPPLFVPLRVGSFTYNAQAL
ncbi:hypothetical protein B0T20DRAFT_119703 [Sordaria brevicollis]|uniref:Uncharacterized protein n=1 Tax=Sordaria brevicollis TaxID=83679 RepID=A0AAE0PKE2_SORBR|nr:hypothetical protein B0T20DRAFT_119703 [Sordaria brevicollis]